MKPKRFYEAELFFVRALGPYCAGILLAGLLGSASWLYDTSVVAAVLFLLLIFLNVFYRSFELYNYRGVVGLLSFAFFFCSGMLICLLNQEVHQDNHFANYNFSYLKIRIIEDTQQRNGLLKFKARVIKGYDKTGVSKHAGGSVLVSIRLKDNTLLRDTAFQDSLKPVQSSYIYGAEMIIPARYKPVDAPANPGMFDYKSWLAMQNIHHQVYINERDLKFLKSNNGNKLIGFALHWRAEQIAYYRRILKNKEAFGLASTLILGYRADLSSETLDVYSKTGTIHALSVSGMHVGLIYLIIHWSLWFLNKKKSLIVIRFLVIVGLVWFYTLITGFSASVLRSSIMLTVFLIAKTFHKQSNSYNILAFAAFCLLLYNPFYLWDVGFQLSFLAVLGLVYLQPKLQYCIDIKSKLLQKLWGLVAISISAQTATFTLSIYYFHQFPVYFILSNLFITLPIALLMYMGLLILLFKLDFLGPVFERMILWTNEGLYRLADLPLASLSGLWINKTELLFLSFITALFCVALAKRNKKDLLAATFCLLVFQSLYSFDQLKAAHQQEKIVFKLRKNHATAYLSGHSALLITNLKPEDQVYRYNIQPALDLHHVRKLKILRQDTIVLNK